MLILELCEMASDFFVQLFLQIELSFDLLSVHLIAVVLFCLINAVLQVPDLSLLHLQLVVDVSAQRRVLYILPRDLCEVQLLSVPEIFFVIGAADDFVWPFTLFSPLLIQFLQQLTFDMHRFVMNIEEALKFTVCANHVTNSFLHLLVLFFIFHIIVIRVKFSFDFFSIFWIKFILAKQVGLLVVSFTLLLMNLLLQVKRVFHEDRVHKKKVTD